MSFHPQLWKSSSIPNHLLELSPHSTSSSLLLLLCSDESFDSEDSDDSDLDPDSENPDAVAEPEKRPKWAHTVLQDARDIVGDPTDTRRTQSDFEEPPISLTAIEPLPSRHIFLVQYSDPWSYGEAARNPIFESTMKDEYKSLLENQTWDLVPLPSGRKLVIWRWVYRTKRAADGQMNRYKARLVAKGFQQVHGIDYDETFTRITKMDSIRLELVIVVAKGSEVHQMDMKNAFLHGDLSEEIYMEHP
jgi:hypothetical protein